MDSQCRTIVASIVAPGRGQGSGYSSVRQPGTVTGLVIRAVKKCPAIEKGVNHISLVATACR